jgi:EAL domain-containing protein (putative c-di-GMP-specific phosphodiesterase class I)
MEIEHNLRTALNGKSFHMLYQPQINIESHKIIGLEALVRWEHNGQIISPLEFIPVAEKSGLILPLGYEILEMSIMQSSEWNKKSIDFGKIAINISIGQLNDENFIQRVQELLTKYNCDPSLILFEITESYIMDNPEKAIKILQKLRDIGIELAIDDFGTGYSSLAYLKKLPINKLKIDKSFINDILTNPDDKMIVKTIVNLGINLGLEVIAEGVESVEQEYFLLGINCPELQGYLFSKPEKAEVIEARFFNKQGFLEDNLI